MPLLAFAVALVATSGGESHIRVRETLAPGGVFVVGLKELRIANAASMTVGRNGWTFDLTKDCMLVIAFSPEESAAYTELRLYQGTSNPKEPFKLVDVLMKVKGGLTSPVFSPDRKRVAVVSAAENRVMELTVATKSVVDRGPGTAAVWTTDNSLMTSIRDENGCSILRRVDGKGVAIRDTLCKGDNVPLPIASGVVAPDAPMLMTDGADARLIGLLGAKTQKIPDLSVAANMLGVGCLGGQTYRDVDGNAFSVVSTGSGWVVERSEICQTESPSAKLLPVKQQTCALPAPASWDGSGPGPSPTP